MTERPRLYVRWPFAAGLTAAVMLAAASWAGGAVGWGVPSIVGKDLTINNSLTVTGADDEVQFTVTGDASQTANLATFQDTDASDSVSVFVDDTDRKIVSTGGGIEFVPAGMGLNDDAILFSLAQSTRFTVDRSSGSASGDNPAADFICGYKNAVQLECLRMSIGTSGSGFGAGTGNAGLRLLVGTTAALAAARSSHLILLDPTGNASDAADSFRDIIRADAPTTASGGTDRLLSVGTGYDDLIAASSGDVTFTDYAPTVTMSNSAGNGENLTLTMADAAAASDGDGGSLVLNYGALDGAGSDGDFTENLNAGSQHDVNCSTTDTTNTTGCFRVRVDGAAVNAVGLRVDAANTADVSDFRALHINMGNQTALTGTKERIALEIDMNGDASDAAGVDSVALSFGTVADLSGGTDTVIRNEEASVDRFLDSAGGHIRLGGADPTLSSCGTGPSITGSDEAGKITIGSGATTSCTVTFAAAFGAAPACVITGEDSATTYAATTSTTALTITSSGTMEDDVVMYHCIETD